jgi:hypothetical protein
MKAKLVREYLNEFHQTGDPLKSLGLGHITISMEDYLLDVDKNLRPIKNDDAKILLNDCKENNVIWKIVKDSKNYPGTVFRGPIIIEYTGTKDDLIPIIMRYDSHVRDENQLRNALSNWDGNQEELDEILS